MFARRLSIILAQTGANLITAELLSIWVVLWSSLVLVLQKRPLRLLKSSRVRALQPGAFVSVGIRV